MNNLLYLPFLLFIIAAYIFYQRKGQKKNQYYREKRDLYLNENSGLTEEQSKNLAADMPWIGMDSELLIFLFGEPGKKRVLDESLTRIIWSYADLFIYLHENTVVEWKKR